MRRLFLCRITEYPLIDRRELFKPLAYMAPGGDSNAIYGALRTFADGVTASVFFNTVSPLAYTFEITNANHKVVASTVTHLELGQIRFSTEVNFPKHYNLECTTDASQKGTPGPLVNE